MRVTSLRDPASLARTFVAMPRMIAHLERDPDSGLLSYDMWCGRTTLMLSYWRDREALRAVASDADAPHRRAWRTFGATAGRTGRVGIGHETYELTPGHHELNYANMPAFGLGKAVGTRPVGDGARTFTQRLAGRG